MSMLARMSTMGPDSARARCLIAVIHLAVVHARVASCPCRVMPRMRAHPAPAPRLSCRRAAPACRARNPVRSMDCAKIVYAASPGVDDDVVHLGRADAEFIHGYRLDVLAIGRDHGQLESRDAHVEEAHRRAVDDAQAHALAGLERPGPVTGRRASPFNR